MVLNAAGSVTGQGVVNFRKWFLKHAEEFWMDLYTYLSHFDALRDIKESSTSRCL
jgi:hypothetical protein